MPTLPHHRREVDLPNARVKIRPSSTFDVTDLGDNFPTPAWWEGRIRFDAGRVYLTTRMVRVIYTCLAGTDNYTLQSGTVGVASGPLSFYDVNSTRIGQVVVVDPILQSTNGREYNAELIAKSGDARSLTVRSTTVRPSGVDVINLDLMQGATEVAPVVGATYTVDIVSHPTLPAP